MDYAAIKQGVDSVARYDRELVREGNIQRIAEKLLIALVADVEKDGKRAWETSRLAFIVAETFVEECERRNGG